MINVQKDVCLVLSLTLCTIFEICSQFSKIAIFVENHKKKKKKKIHFLKNVIFLTGFHVVHLAVH